jgi:hypothetical protein
MQHNNRFVGSVPIVRESFRNSLPSKPVQVADFGLNDHGDWSSSCAPVIYELIDLI